MRVVDTSAWIEWLTGSPLGKVLAADCHRQYKLAMADAVVYATARDLRADLLTCDAHFEHLPGVALFRKDGAAL